MRARFLLTVLAIVALALASAAAGCGNEENGSAAGAGALMTLGPSPGIEESRYETVDVRTASDAVRSNQDAQLLDVREPAEWADTGVPEGAALISLGELGSRAVELATERPVYVICRSGNRSRTASDLLVGLGFTQVYNVDGGVTAWLDAGLPVETYQP